MPSSKPKLKEQIEQRIQKNRLAIMAFVLPAAILLISYLIRGVFPIGNRDILTIDLYHQYAPFLAELQRKLSTGGSLLYTWAGGLGTNFWALYAYYLASPLNIILVLFPASWLTEAVLTLTLIKIGLCSAFFFVYLRGMYKKENLQMVAVSMFYALSAYALAYSWDIMWLDGLFMLPLLMLGLNRLVKEGRWLLYCLSVAYILYSNYYIAFFIVLFTILYFPVVMISSLKIRQGMQILKAIGRFIAYSVLGAALSAVLSLPTYFSLQLTSAADDSFPRSITHYFDLFDYIGQHFMLVSPTIRSGMPNMYAGVLAMLLIPIYFLARSIPLKQKVMNLALILVMILSFNINVLNFIWHGFHFPNQLPYRNSFVYIFLILTLAYPALRRIHEFSGKQIGTIALSGVGLVLLAQKLNDEPMEIQTLYVTIIFIALYAIVLTIDRFRKIRKADLAIALMIVVIAELTLNTILTVHRIDTTEYYSTREGYLAGQEVEDIRDAVADLSDDGDVFFRMESIPPKTINDGFMYGYNGLSIFASTMAMKPVSFFENMGYHSNSINSYKYESSTILNDALFGIKYLIRRSGNTNDTLREKIISTDNIEVYENPYALSVGYAGTNDLLDWYSEVGNPFEAQNTLVNALTGSESDVFYELGREVLQEDNMTVTNSSTHYYSFKRTNTGQESSTVVSIDNDEDRHVYLYFQTAPNKPSRGYVMVGETRIDFNARRSTLVEVGYVEAGTPIELNVFYSSSADTSGMFQLYAFALDMDVFEDAVQAIGQQQVTVSKITDRTIEGLVTAREDSIVMMTIPYDKGWTVTVDGQKVDTLAIDKALVGFPVSAGTHQIRLSYLPPWFLAGVAISAGALLILIIILMPGSKKKKGGKRPDVREITLERPPEETPIQDELPKQGAEPDGTENDGSEG